ncbi:MAG: hypothetical protein JWM98_1276 [Thermoleophilia bacterium]|nr:hypothetical protein [Thermoleophilia bacterium]
MSTPPPPTRTRADGAFTMIEMIVVMVVLGLAMAAIFPAIGNIMRGSGRGAASSQATGDAGTASRMLEEDIRSALGDRGTGERTDIENAGAVGVRLNAISALNSPAAINHDIVVAGPTHLRLNADVLPAAGIESIDWQLWEDDARCGDRSDDGHNWCLTRTVTGGGGGTSEVAVRSRGTYPQTSTCAPGNALAAAKRIFCYQEAHPTTNSYTWNAGWTSACTSEWRKDGPNAADTSIPTGYTLKHNAVDPITRISRLDRVITVGAVLLAGSGFGNANERSYENITVAIRSHEGESYREAIMCGTRAGWGR